MRIAVEFPEVRNLNYTEYLLTGFHQLRRAGVIDRLSIRYHKGVSPSLPGRLERLVRAKLRRPRPGPPLEHILQGQVTTPDRRARFVVDCYDATWTFGTEELMETSDLYFKCQCPRSHPEGIARISNRYDMPFPDFAKRQLSKLRPLMLGRPLSRLHRFDDNLALLRRYEERRRQGPRNGSTLIFFGMCYDNPPHPLTHHPHFKRALLVGYAAKNIPTADIIFSLSKQDVFRSQVPPDVAALDTGRRVPDPEYFELITRCAATVNIMGLAGSIPFRIVDSFLGGALLLSDSLRVDWYEPLKEGVDYLSLGDLGYELLEDIRFEESCERLRSLAARAGELRNELAPLREERFRRHYSPVAMARRVLTELGIDLPEAAADL